MDRMLKIFSGIISVLLLSCITARAQVQVTVSILPQKYFVERIGGDRVVVSVMVQPGAAPNVYEPKPRQMVRLSGSKIYFAIGVPFEDVWLDRIAAANSEMIVIHTDDGIEKLSMAAHSHGEEEHAVQDVHDEEGIKDPHIWLSPKLVMLQARHILTALISADPEHKDSYIENYNSFIEDITDLDTELLSLFSGQNAASEFIVFHPAWGYFARDYGLTQIPIEIEGKEPKPVELTQLIQHAREHRIKTVFVQPQINPQSAALIAREIGGGVVPADPLAEDWLENLRRVARQFKESIK
ncbi:metal ABC transporter solute-binding protein, Zn/Mn family [candidate division KSB1 bacterium]